MSCLETSEVGLVDGTEDPTGLLLVSEETADETPEVGLVDGNEDTSGVLLIVEETAIEVDSD